MADEEAANTNRRFMFRAYLSLNLSRSANFLAVRAKEAEESPPEYARTPDQQAEIAVSYVVGSLLASVASLEARINEILCDLAEDPDRLKIRSLRDGTALAINRIVASGLIQRSRMSTLEKADLVLSTLGCSPLEKDQNPYQDVRLLILLRNAIVHFEPEWLLASAETPQKEQHRLERALLGRFAPSPFAIDVLPFFPRRCLSAGCARWAIEAVFAFQRVFAERIGLNPDRIPINASRRTGL